MSKNKTILILLVLGLVFRCMLLCFFYDSYLDTSRMMTHYEMAHQLAQGNGFVVDNSFLSAAQNVNGEQQKNNDFYKLNSTLKRSGVLAMPQITDVWGYTVLLAIVWKIVGIESYIPLQLLQICFDTLMILLIYGIVIRLFQRKSVAVVASALYAVFVPFIYFASIANREVFANWGMIVVSFLVIKSIYDKRPLYAWLAGISLAFFCWFRPFIIYIPVVFFFYSIILNKRAWKSHFAVFCGTALPLFIFFVVPFAIIYHAQFGTYKFVSVNGMISNLWEGMGAYENPFGFKLSDEVYSARARELGFTGPGNTPEFYDVMSKDVINALKQKPLFYFEFLGKNIGSALTIPLLTGDTGIHYANYVASGEKTLWGFIKDYPIIFIFKALKHILGWLMPICALLSLIMWRNEFRAISILPMLYLSKVFVHATNFLDPRSILEGYFPVLVLCAAFIVGLYQIIHPSFESNQCF